QQESPLRGIPYRDIMRSDWGRGELMGLDISIREAGHVRIVDLQGRLIIGAEADRLQTELRRLIENGYRQIVVNLSCVEQIDSTGISTLVRNCTGLVRARSEERRVGKECRWRGGRAGGKEKWRSGV